MSVHAMDQAASATGVAKRRAAAVVGSILATAAVWLVGVVGFDVELSTPVMGNPPQQYTIGLPFVLVASAAAALLGWALVAVLDRVTAHARAIWTTVAVVVFLLSLGAPWSGTGITAANRVVLTLMHVAVAAVLIPGMYRTLSRRGARTVELT
jgi:Family of unknown function (DUF6069)